MQGPTRPDDPDSPERELVRRWHQAHIEKFQDAAPLHRGWRDRTLTPETETSRQLVEQLKIDRDLPAFQAGTDRWTRSFESGFGGFSGQMIINQINKRSPNPEKAVQILSDALTTPIDLDSARQKINAVAEYMESLNIPAVRAPFLTSYFWGMDDPRTWPVAWTMASDYLVYCTGRKDFADQGHRYAELYEFATEIDGDLLRFEEIAAWWFNAEPLVIDEVLCDRASLCEEQQLGSAPEFYRENAQVLVSVADHIGKALKDEVSDAAQRPLETRKPPLKWNRERYRGDLWVDWRVPGRYGLSIRVWLNGRGLAVGLRPYPRAEPGATQEAVDTIEQRPLDGYEIIAGGRSVVGTDRGYLGGGTGEIIYARWFDRSELSTLDLQAEVVKSAAETIPLMKTLDDAAEPQEADEKATEVTASLSEDDGSDSLDNLADELLVDREFLDDILELLEDKGQVIFYGPPGTGKTYFARKLAEALVSESEDRPIVQFHPSTSYEDFFEGYRPVTDDHGQLSYDLKPGPLARLAAAAQAAPERRHIMIIDEINRANLPKVLGELLFLLEYRGTPVSTLYRPDEPFVLPENLWFIGTMNTADRSIALIDAALRRRFHFIGFFPEQGRMSGILDRWLEREGENRWVGELVRQVNEELELELGGPHLQLGASHFMKPGVDKNVLRRIWEYNIEPFIEDQFFGDQDRIDRFRFQEVWDRFEDVVGDIDTTDGHGSSLEA